MLVDNYPAQRPDPGRNPDCIAHGKNQFPGVCRSLIVDAIVRRLDRRDDIIWRLLRPKRIRQGQEQNGETTTHHAAEHAGTVTREQAADVNTTFGSAPGNERKRKCPSRRRTVWAEW